MFDLPTGTITFLLTDIEGSTRLWEQLPDLMPAALARHDAVAADIVARHHGMVVKARGEGDSLFCVFGATPDAVAAACAMQRAMISENWPGDLGLRVRIALHSGPADLRSGDYYGTAVNRCARLRAIAHGGQVLLSDAARERAGDVLPSSITLLDMGQHRLKDLQQPERVWQLLHPDLPAEFPALRSLSAVLNNLPTQTSSFVGREDDIEILRQQLRTSRLVTLTGFGGTGKTRLSLQVAAECVGAFVDGVWFVELAPLADDALLPQTLASVLGIREEPGRPILQTVIEHVRDRELLLILDNCEHMIAASASFVASLLRQCPRVQVIATSREALGVRGEVLHRTTMLSTPAAGQPLRVDQLLESEAARLFVDRASAVSQTFALTERNATALALICSRLDGIPLAIELAAARVRVMPVEQIAARLDDCFRLLTGGSRMDLPHHQTLRATIDWSYDLLTANERLLLARLSVFAGGWELEAAQTVCAGDGIDDWEVLDLLTSLVDKSLVIFDDPEGAGRFRLLETVRQYACDRLDADVGAATVAEAHAEYYRREAERWTLKLEDFGEAQQAMETMQREIGNMRAGMDRCEHNGQDRLVCAYALALARFFLASGLYTEGDRRLGAADEAAGRSGDLKGRAQVLLQRGRIAWLRSDLDGARGYYTGSYEVCRQLDDRPRQVPALINLGNVAWAENDFALAREQYDLALTLARETSQPRYEAFLLGNLGVIASDLGEFEEATRYCEQGLVMHRHNNNIRGCADTRLTLADVLRRQKQYDQAASQICESQRTFQSLGLQHEKALAAVRLAEVRLEQGRIPEAESEVETGLRIAREIEDIWSEVPALTIQARILGAHGDAATAAGLYRQALEICTTRSVGGRKQMADLVKHAGYTFLETGHAAEAYRAFVVAHREFSAAGLWDRHETARRLEELRETLGTEAADCLDAAATDASFAEALCPPRQATNAGDVARAR